MESKSIDETLDKLSKRIKYYGYTAGIEEVNKAFRDIFGSEAVGYVKSYFMDGTPYIESKFFNFKDKKSGKDVQIIFVRNSSDTNINGTQFSYFIGNKKYELSKKVEGFYHGIEVPDLKEGLKEMFKRLNKK